MYEPSVYTHFSGMNLDVNGYGAGGDCPLVEGGIVCVHVRGCIVTSVGKFFEDVCPSDGVAIVVGWAVAGYGKSARVGGYVLVPWGVVGGLVWVIGVLIAGL